jgi:hypothetical protein
MVGIPYFYEFNGVGGKSLVEGKRVPLTEKEDLLVNLAFLEPTSGFLSVIKKLLGMKSWITYNNVPRELIGREYDLVDSYDEKLRRWVSGRGIKVLPVFMDLNCTKDPANVVSEVQRDWVNNKVLESGVASLAMLQMRRDLLNASGKDRNQEQVVDGLKWGQRVWKATHYDQPMMGGYMGGYGMGGYRPRPMMQRQSEFPDVGED